MKRSKFSEEQVAYALRQVEAGTPVGDVCRQRGDVLRVEEEVRPPGGERAPAPAATRGRKQSAEAPRRRSHARQAHAVRGAAKKRVKPARRRIRPGGFR